MPSPMKNLQYARSYVFDQPYICVAKPAEALKWGTIFPFLLNTYLGSLKAVEKGENLWKL
jgi:hypothetical protein